MATIITKTVGPAKDYASLAAGIAGEFIARPNLVANDEILKFVGDAFVDAAPVNIAGFTMDTNHYIWITSAVDHLGVYDNVTPGSYFLSVVNNGSYALQIGAGQRVHVEGIMTKNAGVGAGTCDFQVVGAVGGGRLRLDRALSISTGWGVYSAAGAVGPSVQIIRSYLSGGLGALGQVAGNTLRAQSCVLNARNAGVNSILTQNTSVYKNCYFYSNGGVCIPAGTWGTQIKCATSDASSADAALRNIPFNAANFVDTVTHKDVHLVLGSALIDVGHDTSGDASPYDFTTDVNGNSFGSAGVGWDIGFHEFGGTPPGTPVESRNDLTHNLRGVYDATNNKLQVVIVAAGSTGSKLSPRQILHDVWVPSTQKFRIVDVGGAPNANVDNLSFAQILQKVHDPTSNALRVQQGVAVGAGSKLSTEQIMQACYDPTNIALRCSPAGGGGSGGGSKLSFQQILQAIYDPGVGLRMSV